MKRIIFLFLLLCFFTFSTNAQELPKLENPFTESFVKQNMTKSLPRIGLNTTTKEAFLKQVKTDPVTKNLYQALRRDAYLIFDMPLLERKMTGRRLLHVSREMLRRMNCLAMVYVVEKDQTILARIDEELHSVAEFTDWNPSHFLDVAEMALAVSIGLDWTEGDLPNATIAKAENALIEKAIDESLKDMHKRRFFGHNNWNQVLNGGLSAAAIAIGDKHPELAAKVLSRAMEGIPYALEKYMPDGLYQEGSTYWTYGTSFTLANIVMLQSAFGSDFGISEVPALIKSADFKVQMNAPTGMYYDFADCGTNRKSNGDMPLAWFATHTGNASYFEKERFLKPLDEITQLNRLCGLGLIWISQFEPSNTIPMAKTWKGDGENPVVVFRDKNDFYFGGKGGRATTSHGNMDAGSFIFEYKGIRWVTDPGNQNYHDLEKVGFDLWNSEQDGQRWTLLTKNNYGHSTLTVNNELFYVNGEAKLLDFQNGKKPKASFDLTPLYFGNVEKAERTFLKENTNSILISDKIISSPKTKIVTWQLLTAADVEITKKGALFTLEGEQVVVTNLSHPDSKFKVVSLDPPPLELDKTIDGLKRLELHIPVSEFQNGEAEIRVRISGK